MALSRPFDQDLFESVRPLVSIERTKADDFSCSRGNDSQCTLQRQMLIHGSLSSTSIEGSLVRALGDSGSFSYDL